MGGVETLFIAVAILSVIILAVVLLKFKNFKSMLVTGLAIVAVILAMVLFTSTDAKNSDSDVLLNNTNSPSFATGDIVGDKSDNNTGDDSSSVTDTSVATATTVATAVVTKSPSGATYKTPVPAETANPDIGKNSIIYLTFDDGPSDRTVEVLDVLKKYNIKATFFIIDFDDWQIPVLKRVIDEGHSIAIHGYSHVYSKIYASEEAFMENVTLLRDKIKSKLGYDTTLMRFPGGSSSSQAEKYCPGIMSKLVKRVEKEGYQYFDWNVDSGDAEGFKSDGIINRIKTGTKGSRTFNIVLMHDAQDKTETVKSLPTIIEWGIANGYTFSNLDASSPTAHHRTSN